MDNALDKITLLFKVPQIFPLKASSNITVLIVFIGDQFFPLPLLFFEEMLLSCLKHFA